MKKIMKHKRIINFILITTVSLCSVFFGFPQGSTVNATTSTEMQTQIEEHENDLEEVQGQIEALYDEQDLIQEKIDDLNAEIINTMSSIGLKENEIAEKEAALEAKHEEVLAKQQDIEETYQEYLAAKEQEEQQYADLLVWMRCMYENSNLTYLTAVLQGEGLAELLNQMDYIEKVYAYGMKKLSEYESTKVSVKDLWHLLETEKKLLETEENDLKEDKEQLLIDEKALRAQKQELDLMLAKKKEESANSEAEIKGYIQQAAAMQLLLQREKDQLKQLQEQEEQERLEAEQAQQEQQEQENSPGADDNYTDTGYIDTIEKAAGSDLGKKVAKYACQYIGNPYVYGGTSLTTGADCSGFVYRVYKDFGYDLPRTSLEQRSAGKDVGIISAQPGDIVCYDGHVGIYIGAGKIVHASNSQPYPRGGIKISNMDYRPILAVRRVI